ncbi:LysR family transcriptional regulator [uncultured Maritimibacter sp.]|jgi:DNA-binding transcriptional LysR family regulator|uniref:LysR family transcriptional regulator n=1 Tax=uncultured Maritimibacter sp. TaxID=991866 RepID=UPI000A9361A0|nr:LysR family transcriptional regulator [uncultured Maritimibacter sp.]
MSSEPSVTLRQLRILNGIVVGGSIRKGAEALGLTQPTVSLQLAKLEDAVGSILINRDRQRSALLTQPGELWARVARSVVEEVNQAQDEHDKLFKSGAAKIHFVAQQSHRGMVMGIAARLASNLADVAEFSMSTAGSSQDVRERLELRQSNIGLFAIPIGSKGIRGFHMVNLYEDRLVWAVPRSVRPQAVRAVLDGSGANIAQLPPLSRRVHVDSKHLWRSDADLWFGDHLPRAIPFYRSDLHMNAVEIVADGLATCLVTTSISENMPDRLRDQIAFYETGIAAQMLVLAVPSHLMSHSVFACYFEALADAVIAHHESRKVRLPPDLKPASTGS